MVNSTRRHVAVIGAGIAGAWCARRLADAGCAVTVFDKSRGVGGRMATRRGQWPAFDTGAATAVATVHDHGAPAFSARSERFRAFVRQAAEAGWLQAWQPRVDATGHQPLDEAPLWVAQPDMPALARGLLDKVTVMAATAVDAIERVGLASGEASPAGGWRLSAQGQFVGAGFDTLVIAIPPAQAAPLVQPHRPEWATAASHWPMLPTWTLLASLEASSVDPLWDLSRPVRGPLSLVTRINSKPGRDAASPSSDWVAHASAEWSATHLEADPREVRLLLERALADALQPLMRRPPDWRSSQVHRWRYAEARRADAPATPSWWCPTQALGCCGDHLGGGGVEGAWTSADHLADRLLGR
jgi:renalase